MNDPFLYHKEPEEVFLPLSTARYAEFYAIEMDGFVQDISFYQSHCRQGAQVLELGCGTGRISRALASSGCHVTSLDISYPMLTWAHTQANNNPFYVCMDMTRMAFCQKFDHILIPYNTLNLLRDESAIHNCLQQVHDLLKPEGTLLFQLYIPDRQLIELNGRKLFQFQMFSLNHPQGKLIKETLRSFLPEKKEILLEERYRYRPVEKDIPKEDFSHLLRLAGWPEKQWVTLLRKNGFAKLSPYGDYNSRPYLPGEDSLLLIKAELS